MVTEIEFPRKLLLAYNAMCKPLCRTTYTQTYTGWRYVSRKKDNPNLKRLISDFVMLLLPDQRF